MTRKYVLILLFVALSCSSHPRMLAPPAPGPVPRQEMQASLVSTPQGDQLELKVVLPQPPKSPFGTQALDLGQIKYLRCWVKGSGIQDRLWNKEGFAEVLAPKATLRIAAIPRGANRIVAAVGYNANQEAIAGAVLKAVYSSPPGGGAVTVVLKWKFLALGETLEKLLEMDAALAEKVDAPALQQLVEKVIFGANPTDGNIYAVHPSRLDTGALAAAIQQAQGRVPQQFDQLIPGGSGTLNLRNAQGTALGQDVTLVIDDPASAPLTIPGGTGQAVLNNVAPGTWQAVAKTTTPLGEVTRQTTLTVARDGSISFADNPLVFPPILTSLQETKYTETPANLVSWWSADNSANDKTGINHGGVFNGVGYAAGQLGLAFNFDGVDDYVEVADADALRPAQLTLEAWVNPSNLSVLAGLVTKEPTGASGQSGYGFRQRNNNKFWAMMGREGAGELSESGTSLATNTWYHLIEVYEGSQIKLYLNGVLEAVSPSNRPVDSTFPLRMGRLNSGIEPFRGLVDDVQLYNRPLSGAEALTQFTRRSAVTITGEGFSPIKANNTVLFGNTAVPVTEASATALVVAVPAGLSGSVPVKVIVNNLSSREAFYNATLPNGSSAAQAGLSCQTLKTDNPALLNGTYWLDPNGGSTADAYQVYCDMVTDGGGWTFVRRQRPGAGWSDTPNDNLAGVAAYGAYAPNPTVNASFGLAFANIPYSELLFRTGDEGKWMILDKPEVYNNWSGATGCAAPGTVKKSHIQGTPLAVGWCKRPAQPEDPWFSARDHNFGGTSCGAGGDNDTHSMLYGETLGLGVPNCWAFYVNNRNGVNVWIR